MKTHSLIAELDALEARQTNELSAAGAAAGVVIGRAGAGGVTLTGPTPFGQARVTTPLWVVEPEPSAVADFWARSVAPAAARALLAALNENLSVPSKWSALAAHWADGPIEGFIEALRDQLVADLSNPQA